jgi:tetratricopeptide (TPR) repeat protein
MKKKNFGHYYLIGLKKNLQGRYREALEDYTKEIELNPSNVDAYIKRGTLGYKILKKYKTSLLDFSQAIELDPNCAVAYLHRGIVQCHLLNFREALPDFDKAIELDPNDERSYFNRGKNKYMLNYEKNEVLKDLERAIRLGSAPAADMIKLFYGQDQSLVRDAITKGVEEKARDLD